MNLDLPHEFSRRIELGVELLRKHESARIISHYDGDGLCSAGILAKALLREGISFQATATRALDEEMISSLKKERRGLMIFSDMGSGMIEKLEDMGDVIILDHHAPNKDSEKIVHINPHLVGIDGMRGACAATVSFLFAVMLNENNWDMFGIALAGAIADRQHVGGLEGLNQKVVESAKEVGIVRQDSILSICGDNVGEALEYSINPYVKGISGNSKEVESLLKSIELSPTLSVKELSGDAKRALSSILSIKLLRQGVEADAIAGIVEDGYWLPDRETYANWLAAYINACGRMGKRGRGISICLGDSSALSEAKELRKLFLKEVLASLRKVEEQGAHEMKNIQFFYGDKSTHAGTAGGIAMRYLLNPRKATLVLTVEGKKTRISGRATRPLVSAGLNLAEAFKDSAQSLGGAGGGHSIAAGASIPKGKEEKFLEYVDRIISAQLEKE